MGETANCPPKGRRRPGPCVAVVCVLLGLLTGGCGDLIAPGPKNPVYNIVGYFGARNKEFDYDPSPPDVVYWPKSAQADQWNVLWHVDVQMHTVWKEIGYNGIPIPVAGLNGISGYYDGGGIDSRFSSPSGICLSNPASGNPADLRIYVADTGNHVMRMVLPNGLTYTVAGNGSQPGFLDGPFSYNRLNGPTGCAASADGNRLYIADSGNSYVRFVDFDPSLGANMARLYTLWKGACRQQSILSITPISFTRVMHCRPTWVKDGGVPSAHLFNMNLVPKVCFHEWLLCGKRLHPLSLDITSTVKNLIDSSDSGPTVPINGVPWGIYDGNWSGWANMTDLGSKVEFLYPRPLNGGYDP